jgi:hypothetical protein
VGPYWQNFPTLNSCACSNYLDVEKTASEAINAILAPNPATTQLNINIDETLVGAQLNIYNTTGALVQATQLQTINNKLETGNLPAGMYIAEVKTREGSFKKRWVKM